MKRLLENNRRWSARMNDSDPTFFERLSKGQSPRYLWIGCADSRVSADQIVDMMPGSIFVHRNVANLVIHTDVNALSVIQYAVDVLGVEHIIVCGHYGCGGIEAAYRNSRLGLIDNWLRNVQEVMALNRDELEAIGDETERLRRLCELNVIEQVRNVSRTTIVQEAWDRGQILELHGLVYGLTDGLLKDLDITVAD